MPRKRKTYYIKILENFKVYPKCFTCNKELKKEAVLIEKEDKNGLEIHCLNCTNDMILEEDLDDYLLESNI